jgi:hypothetical protein
MDHNPPPPYSVTDLYSNSGSRLGSQPQPHPTLTATTSNFDNASVPGRSISEYDAASSTGDPTIYTPPYTPDGDRSSHQDSVADGFDNVSSPASATAASASAYFESRPILHFSPDTLLVHSINITKHTQPSDIPFPEPEKKWLERDMLPQDWETFVNYLIPHHTDASNHDVAERKLKAELIDERMHRLTLDQNDTSRTDLRHVDAQLEPLRRSHTEEGVHCDVNGVIDAWNMKFFGPRNIFIEAPEPQSEDGMMAMPGSWTNDPAEAAANGQSQVPPCTSRRGLGGSWIRADNNGFHIGRNMISADNNGFRIGRSALVADSNGFRIGNLLVADGQGFKLGPIRADARGFRIGGGTHVPHEHHRGYHPEHHPVHIPTTLRGRPSAREFSSRMPQRDRSHSTSSSSSSGASSIESAGSLPDYDHLKDAQLPVAKQAIKDWLNHPDQPITKQTVKQIIQEIKAAKCGSSSINEADRDALRKEVRDLFKEFKVIVKNQKKAWKAAKRERRSLRREAKRTRRAARREVKLADRDVKHAEREARRAAKKEVKAGKMPQFPPMPEVPPVHTPPGAWPLENESQRPPHPPFYMPPLSPTHSMPQMGMSMDGRGWPFMENSQAANAAKAALLQAEGRRIEAEAKREEALRRAEETRQKALDKASAARSRAEENRQEAEAKAAIAREKAQATAALARERAEQHRQRAEANASIARQKAEANRMLADSNKILADVNRMRMQAQQLKDKKRLELLNIAEKLEEEAEKLKREGERAVAEALQSQKDLTYAFRESEPSN